MTQFVEDKENLKAPMNIEFQDFYNMVKEYYLELTKQLAERGAIDKIRLTGILENLVEKYGVSNG